MSPECFPLPALTDNYIWVIRHQGHCVVVDPGDAQPVQAYLAKSGDTLAAILVTHHHHDHIGGISALIEANPVPVYGPHLPLVSQPVADGAQIALPGLELTLEVMAVPGHTLDHLAYVWQPTATRTPPQAPWLFCGDTLFSCGCGRLFEGTPATMLASLDKLAALPANTEIYCTHEYTQANIRFALACEPDNAALRAWEHEVNQRRQHLHPSLPTTLARELQVNPFLRSDIPELQQRLAAHHNTPVTDRLTAFTLMREWKNNFR